MTIGDAPHHVLNLPLEVCMADVLSLALRDAKEVAVAVAFVHMSGLHLLLPALAGLRDRGARVRILTSTYMLSTEPQALRSLNASLGAGLRVQDGEPGVHAKSHLLVRGDGGRVAWVGSSNWTLTGLRNGLEWNARVTDPDALTAAWTAFETLWARGDVRAIDDAWLDAYTARWHARQPLPPPVAEGVAEADAAYEPALQPTELQQHALERLAEARGRGDKRALVVAATGTGKTLLAAFDVARANAKTLLFVAHRKDIVAQAAREFAKVFGADFAHDLVAEGRGPTGAPFVFVTVQALLGAGGRRLLAAGYDYVVVDEFHHAEAQGWQRALRELAARFLLGLTATPERADGRDVAALCDHNVVYEIRLPEAIRRGFLLPFHYFGVADDERVDHEGLRGADEETLGAALSLTTRAELVLAHAVEKGYDGPRRVAVGFCAGVAHAEFMRREFEARGRAAAVVSGSTALDARAAIYTRLQDPAEPLEWLFVADVLNEGVDLPALNVVLFLRPTESPVIFLQQLGRGLRKHPSTKVLTVIDLVGLHRRAFEVLRALHDPHGVPTPRGRETFRGLREVVTAPEGCEILLDDKTIEVLQRVQRMTSSRRQRVEDAYRALRTELGRPPRPVDADEERELALPNVRGAHGSWRHLRVAMGDAAPWERDLEDGGPADALLRLTERNLQQQRVTAYACLWAALDPGADSLAGYERFFDAHPHWRAEREEGMSAGRWRECLESLFTKALLGDALWKGGRWTREAAQALADAALRNAMRDRLEAVLAQDHRARHEGVLGTPADARPFAAYTRREIMNLWGEQYDPTRHNRGVVPSRHHAGHHLLLTLVDTRHAKERHQYVNALVDRRHFRWSSQNRMTPTNPAGAIVAKQAELGARLHLIAGRRSHDPLRYLGEVRVASFEGSGPMTVLFELPAPIPDAVWAELTEATPGDDGDGG